MATKKETAPVAAPVVPGQFEVVQGTLREAAREPSIQHIDIVDEPELIEEVEKDREDGKPPIKMSVHHNSVPKQGA